MGSKKKQTVGYRYFANAHMVLCHGPIDALTKISFSEKDAYIYEETGNTTININKPSLFGGDDQQGGITGKIDLMFGHSDQVKNTKLQAICAKISDSFGGVISAWRGVASVFLDNLYIGTSPNMPDSKWRVKRIHTRHDGEVQWYDAKAEIVVSTSNLPSNSSIYIALDSSSSMTGSKIDILKDAMSIVFAELRKFTNTGLVFNIKIQSWSDSATSIVKNSVVAGDYDELLDFVDSISVSGTTNAVAAYSGVSGFFSPTVKANNICVCVSDGAMGNTADALNDYVGDMVDNQNSPYSITDGNAVKMRGVGIEAVGSLSLFDNSGSDVPVVTGDNAEDLARVILLAIYDTANDSDINPAHIIRECLTNPIWGIGIAESSIDDTSFMLAADTLYAEGMGMSIKWTDSTAISEFVDTVKQHINAQLYLDRISNKWKLYLIRDDYDKDALVSVDEGEIHDLEFERRTLAECTNTVTVTYYDREKAGDSTVSVQDIARIAQQGGVISQNIEYSGFSNSDIAGRVALRELKTLSITLASVSFNISETLSNDWHIGMPFKLSDSNYGLDEAIMRVTAIKFGNGISNSVYVEAVEDSFSNPAQAVVEYVPPIVSDYSAKDAVAIVFEVPFIELVEQYGQDEINAKLLADNSLGYVGMAAIRPNNLHINASLYSDSGAGYEEEAALDFCPNATLVSEIGFMDTSFELENITEFENLEVNNRLQINDEIMSFVSFNETTNMLTVKRGCFGTVLQEHAAGSLLFGWDNYSGIDSTEYLSGEVVSLKASTLTGSDALILSEATAHSVTLTSRAIRPYPPAQVKINGEYFPETQLSSISLTWVHRNRQQQTGGVPLGFEDDGVTPESGTTYSISLLYPSGVVFFTVEGITLTTYEVPFNEIPPEEDFIYIKLSAVRDGFESFQSHVIRVNLFKNTGGAMLFEMDATNTPPSGGSISFEM